MRNCSWRKQHISTSHYFQSYRGKMCDLMVSTWKCKKCVCPLNTSPHTLNSVHLLTYSFIHLFIGQIQMNTSRDRTVQKTPGPAHQTDTDMKRVPLKLQCASLFVRKSSWVLKRILNDDSKALQTQSQPGFGLPHVGTDFCLWASASCSSF